MDSSIVTGEALLKNRRAAVGMEVKSATHFWLGRCAVRSRLSPEHTRHRSPLNFCVNLLCGLIAYCHQPKKPSLHLDTCQMDAIA